jgi:hypothetical protein
VDCIDQQGGAPANGSACRKGVKTAAIAEMVNYVGSAEHKRFPNPLCNPELRTDASDCDAVDPVISQEPARLTGWLREAIRRGQIDRKTENGLPRKAWGWIAVADGPPRLFEVRLTNAGAGQYKGYFIDLEDLQGKLAWAKRKLASGGEWSGVLP